MLNLRSHDWWMKSETFKDNTSEVTAFVTRPLVYWSFDLWLPLSLPTYATLTCHFPPHLHVTCTPTKLHTSIHVMILAYTRMHTGACCHISTPTWAHTEAHSSVFRRDLKDTQLTFTGALMALQPLLLLPPSLPASLPSTSSSSFCSLSHQQVSVFCIMV